MTTFGVLHPDGSVTRVREIRQSDIAACPHFILVAEHYREDGSCRCDARNAPEMQDAGYVWSEQAKRWVA